MIHFEKDFAALKKDQSKQNNTEKRLTERTFQKIPKKKKNIEKKSRRIATAESVLETPSAAGTRRS